MDEPAIVDRETVYLGPISPESLSKRGMHIAGLSGPANATILSKASNGATTRLVTIPPWWGNDGPGAFTADVEILLLSGALTIGQTTILPHSLLIAEENRRLPSLYSESGATALISTSGPIRYQESDDTRDEAIVVSASDHNWVVDDDGFIVKILTAPTSITTRLVFAGHTTTNNWKSLPTWSERLVIHGEWREHIATNGQASVMHALTSMSYVSRPAGTRFEGPGSGTDKTALLVDRVVGPWAPTVV